jgi:hypothetical protein
MLLKFFQFTGKVFYAEKKVELYFSSSLSGISWSSNMMNDYEENIHEIGLTIFSGSVFCQLHYAALFADASHPKGGGIMHIEAREGCCQNTRHITSKVTTSTKMLNSIPTV